MMTPPSTFKNAIDVGEHKLDSDFFKHEINHRASVGEGLLSFSLFGSHGESPGSGSVDGDAFANDRVKRNSQQ
jgi:hypothetical protein